MAKSASTSASRRRSTAVDVARLSGVSRTTVSYVLNDTPGQTIPEATRERVRAAAETLSYVPAASAASLRRGHSRIVIVVTEVALSGYITEPFLAAISSSLLDKNLVPVSHQFSTEEALHALISEIRPYGILSLTSLPRTLIDEMHAAGVPRVYSSDHGDPDFPRPWEQGIGAMQADHVIRQGARSLIYAAPTFENPRVVMAHWRERGVRETGLSHGVGSALRFELGGELELNRETISSYLTGRTFPVGICAFDDQIAAAVVAAVRGSDYTIPRDVLVIGVDDAPFAPFIDPPLTTISIDGKLSGQLVAHRFMNGTAYGGDANPPVIHGTIIRRSTS